MSGRRLSYYFCSRYEHNSGIQAIVRAPTARSAERAARHASYGRPALVRLATSEEIRWQFDMGGIVIEAVA